MSDKTKQRILNLTHALPNLTPGQLFWVESVVKVFLNKSSFKIINSNILDSNLVADFGDALRIHHCFSGEPFSKDKFEYVLEKVLRMGGKSAKLASRGNRGHDITIDGERISLKTQADKNIKEDKIWISKVMELGSGEWDSEPAQLNGLLKAFLGHISGYDRVLILRCLDRGPSWRYELIEIPMDILKLAKTGKLEMKLESKQLPKPGYCHVQLDNKSDKYQLYFDGGGERKLQLKNMPKSHCVIHGEWSFEIPTD